MKNMLICNNYFIDKISNQGGYIIIQASILFAGILPTVTGQGEDVLIVNWDGMFISETSMTYEIHLGRCKIHSQKQIRNQIYCVNI